MRIFPKCSLVAVLRIDRATVTGFTKNFNGQRPLTSIAQSNVVVVKSHNNKSSTHEVTNTYVYDNARDGSKEKYLFRK